jgi:arsenate reductase
MAEKVGILYLCTGNSCRSQIAEAFTNQLKGDEFEAHSAGVSPKGVDPRAIKAMAEVGIDISGYKSKDVSALGDLEFDFVVTLCDNAREACPYFPARTRVMHQGFDDPPKLAASAGDEEEAMGHYRRVRGEIKAFVESLPSVLQEEGKSLDRAKNRYSTRKDLSKELEEEAFPGFYVPVDKKGANVLVTINSKEPFGEPDDMKFWWRIFYAAKEDWTVPSGNWEGVNWALFSGDDPSMKTLVGRIVEHMERLDCKTLLLPE